MKGVIFFLTLQEHLVGFVDLSSLPMKKKTEKNFTPQSGRYIGCLVFGRSVLMTIMKG